MILIILCILLFISTASATEYRLNTVAIEPFSKGINYTGSDPLIIQIEENVTIRSSNPAGIESSAPVIIRSPEGRTLSILVNNRTDMIYGIRAPSVSIESGRIDITVNGQNNNGTSNAFGLCAESGNVTISGGSVFTMVDTACHKNKGIYASRFILISGGLVRTDQRGGSNTFGLDGGDEGNRDSGVRITGGRILVNSSGALNRNIGIDSRSGTVEISGNTVVVIQTDGSGAKQNYAYNPDITFIHGADE
ncbi:hypothetical protein [Methanoregula sp.]|uniref:hypothetical protein n=1 Tax=Methanoregula sp. TaxID=2052170 RepID=UPI0035645C2C